MSNQKMIMKYTPANFVKYFVGMLSIAVGVVLMKRSALGMSSWDTLHNSIDHLSDFITLGMATIFVAMIFTIAVIVLNKHIKYLIMAIPIFFVGLLIDLFDLVIFVDFEATTIFIQIISYTAGLLMLPLGGALLLSSTFPAGVFDEFMLVVARKLNTTKIVLIRVIMETSSVTLALILGLIAGIGLGGINIGTVIFTFSVGSLIKMYLNIFEKMGIYKQSRKQ